MTIQQQLKDFAVSVATKHSKVWGDTIHQRSAKMYIDELGVRSTSDGLHYLEQPEKPWSLTPYMYSVCGWEKCMWLWKVQGSALPILNSTIAFQVFLDLHAVWTPPVKFTPLFTIGHWPWLHYVSGLVIKALVYHFAHDQLGSFSMNWDEISIK